jgi:hypothetical protein
MLKQLIQRLLDSRTTPSEASHSSYPDDGTVTQFSPSATSVSSWTKVVDSTIAPSDGYVIVRGKATGESYVQITAGDNPPHMERSTFAKTTLNQYPILNLPIAKGKTFKVFAENTTEITVGLIKAIGGGYNHLVRRALSCLRPSFNFLPKNSLLAEATGFLTNPIQLFKRRISHLQRQENGFLSSLLATGGSASKGLPRKFCLATGRFGRGAIQQRHLIKAFVFLSQKAGLWPTYYRQTPRAHMSSLFRVSAINSFQTGGALC